MMKANWPYEDIVNLPHHVSNTHPQMDMLKRAAQFAPFSALTGYEEAVDETARLTESETELDETELMELDRKIQQAFSEQWTVTITYFLPDDRKAGGRYVTETGNIKKIHMSEIRLDNGMRIPLRRIMAIDQEEEENSFFKSRRMDNCNKRTD